MEYKILIKLYVPEIEEEYEIYIPINKSIGEVSILLCKAVNDISKAYPAKRNARLCDRASGTIYNQDEIIRDTNIRNGTQLVIF